MNYITIELAGKEYKARLDTRACVELGRKLKTNPLNIMLGVADGGIPQLEDLLIIIHASLQKIEHGISIDKLYDIYDEHVSQGGSIDDLVDIVIKIFQHCGLIKNEETD
jgi:hypothetical protein